VQGWLTQDWWTRIGLTLQFVSLFLVTPQIVGVEAIQNATRDFGKFFGGSFDFVKGHQVQVQFVFTIIVSALITLLAKGSNDSTPMSLLIGLVALVVFFGLTFGLTLMGRLAVRIAESDRSFLIIGAYVFTAGFIALLVATFVPAKGH
jgi:hypothetical protein